MTEDSFINLFNKYKAIIIFIGVMIIGVCWQIIIPINNIQVQLASIQLQLNASGQSSTNLRQDTDNLKLAITTLQLQVANLEKLLK